MTYSVVNQVQAELQTLPLETDYTFVGLAIDITSLDSAGSEPFDPTTYVDTAQGVLLAGQENTEYDVKVDHTTNTLAVSNESDGTDVAQGTDVGQVRLLILGLNDNS